MSAAAQLDGRRMERSLNEWMEMPRTIIRVTTPSVFVTRSPKIGHATQLIYARAKTANLDPAKDMRIAKLHSRLTGSFWSGIIILARPKNC